MAEPSREATCQEQNYGDDNANCETDQDREYGSIHFEGRIVRSARFDIHYLLKTEAKIFWTGHMSALDLHYVGRPTENNVMDAPAIGQD